VRVGKRQRWYAVVALIAAAGTAHADYKDSYSHGLEAYKDGKYAEARQLMQQALDEHAEPAAKIRFYGQVFGPYLPQHFAGLAAFKLGDCATAMAQWGSAANRQIAAQLPEIGGEEQRNAATCGQKTVAKIEDKPAKPPEPVIPKATVAENPPPKTVVAENTPPKPVTPPLKPTPPPVEKPPVEKPVVIARNTPPEPLVQAFDNYLAGRYADVARINPDSYADTRSRFHAYLVRAASKYTLSRISADEEMLKAARADAAAARALDARTTPDATLFSPGFRTFFEASH
jgi:outer membrane biosynthesis protein TonB